MQINNRLLLTRSERFHTRSPMASLLKENSVCWLRNPRPLTESELSDALSTLPGWEPVESFSPGEYPKSRFEFRKSFTSKTFTDAVSFMQGAVRPINKSKPPHHPMWQNQWTTVIIWFVLETSDIKLVFCTIGKTDREALFEILTIKTRPPGARKMMRSSRPLTRKNE
jgi:pterin-4a-carbinolamine dehydratase